MTRATRFTLALALLAIAACDRDPAPAATGNSCSDIVTSFRTEIAKGGACETDTDCACHVGIDEVEPCGGISDSATAKRLADLQRSYADAKCGSKVDCAAWMCEPQCQSGRCGNKPP